MTKNLIDFSIAIIASLGLHLLMLAVPFTMPKKQVSNEDSLKILQIKIGASEQLSLAKSAKNTDNDKQQKIVKAPVKHDVTGQKAQAENMKKVAHNKTAPEKKPNKADKKSAKSNNGNANVKNLATKNEPVPKKAKIHPDAKTDYGVDIGNVTHHSNVSAGKYEMMLPLWIKKFQYYPKEAEEKNLIGVGRIGISIDRKGNILDAKIISSTGHKILDDSLFDMLARANPVIPVPDNYHNHENTFYYKMDFYFNLNRTIDG